MELREFFKLSATQQIDYAAKYPREVMVFFWTLQRYGQDIMESQEAEEAEKAEDRERRWR